MTLRSTCICDGKLIGIESIFSVVDGMQINIPEKVEALRAKSKNGELYCPCGCGANLILVAGDRNLRTQHFRLKAGQPDKECEFVSEGSISIYSKIVLKCWMSDKYPDADIQSRVPICEVEDTDRRYEITLLAKNKDVAISYCYDRANLTDEKLDILDRNVSGIHLHYVCDVENAGVFAQYPEMMMKIQKRQGYCLFLELGFDDRGGPSYPQSKLKGVFYYHNDNGLWTELEIVYDYISSFDFGNNGGLLYSGKSLHSLKEQREQQYINELKQRRRLQEKAREQRRIEEERRRQEAEAKRQKYLAQMEKQRALEAEAESKRKEQHARELKAKEEREKAIRECTKEKIDAIIDNDQEHPFHDPAGNRWVRCEHCGQIFTEDNFVIYGGIHHANLGTCKECSKKCGLGVLPKYAGKTVSEACTKLPKIDPMICPDCGGKLIKRDGPYGAFFGCGNYPKCRYTRKV